MSRKIFIIAGEPSGDALGGALMQSLRAQAPDVGFVGIGGDMMAAQGLDSLRPMDDLCVMGLFEVLGQLPRLLKLINTVVEEIDAAQPDMVITIDLPDFNFEVVKRLKKRGKVAPKFVHYVAPTVWAWRAGRAKMIAGLYDRLLCLLPFEPEYFTPHGLDARFVGHSLVERNTDYDSAALRARFGFSQNDLVVGLFFGSRTAEFKAMGPVILGAAKQILAKKPDVKFLVPTLPKREAAVKALLAEHNIEAAVVADQALKWDAFGACDVAMATSGTVGLELAYLGVPHIVGYKAHPLTAFIARRLVKLDHIHLANVILQARIIPEYLQDEVTAEAFAEAALRLLEDDAARDAQKQKLVELAQILGEGRERSPSQRAADIVLEIL